MAAGMREGTRSSTMDGALFVSFAVALWLTSMRFPGVATTRSLDPSWAAALSHFFAHGMQAGVDYVFTYGPLALVSFHPDTFWAHYAWEVGFGGVEAVTLAHLAMRARRLPGRLLLLVLLLVAVTTAETRYFVFIVAVGLLRVLDREDSLPKLAGAMCCLAAVSAVKFTYLMLSAGVALALGSLWLTRERRPHVALAPALFALAFLVTWALAGQSLANLPSYLAGSLEIARGYSEAMATVGASVENRLVFQLHLLLLALLATRPDLLARGRSRVGLLIVVLGLTFAWKQGFVRQDPAHVRSYFSFIALCPLLAMILRPTPIAGLAPISYAAVIVSVTSAIGAYMRVTFGGPEYTEWVARTHSSFESNVACLLRPGACKDARAREAESIRERWKLPRIAKAVGDAPVDVVSHDQLALLANGLNWRPRPVFQSYTAYTERLTALNGAFLRSARAPAFIMANWDTIDGRFLQADDGQVLLEMLRGYRPLLQEEEFLLVERRSEHERSRERPEELVREAVEFGETIHLPATPGTYLTMEAHMRYTPYGHLRRIAFRSPTVGLHADVSNGEHKVYRLIPGVLHSEFLLSPLMEWNGDLLGIYAGAPPRELSWIRFVRTKASRAAFDDRIDVVIRQYPLPPRVELPPRARRR